MISCTYKGFLRYSVDVSLAFKLGVLVLRTICSWIAARNDMKGSKQGLVLTHGAIGSSS